MVKTAQAFRQVATLAFNVPRAVEEFWREFPEAKDKIFFYDMTTGKLYGYSDTEKAQTIISWIKDPHIREGKLLRQHIREFTDKKASACSPQADIGVNVVLLYGAALNDPQFIFDHEAGHALALANVWAEPNANECFADVYALIRHFQRMGDDAELPNLSYYRAVNTILTRNDTIHYTLPVTDEIIKRRHDTDWQKVTPYMALHMAHGFVMKYKMAEDAYDVMANEIANLHDTWRSGQDEILMDLAEMLLRTRSRETFTLGLRALRDLIAVDVWKFDFKDDYWTDVACRLERKDGWFKKGWRAGPPVLRP